MENINCLYINLDYRTDRNIHIINQFNTLNIQPQRVDAVKNLYGSIGCSLSHIKCLMIAKKNNWKEVMIVEDDITFLEPNLFKNNLNNFLNSKIDFDVLLIAGNNSPYEEINENCIKIYNCQTTTGYIVKQHYYDTLINNIKQSVILLMKQPFNHRFYAIDIWWKHLQKKDNWYLLIPLNITQMSGFSDIEKRITNYSNVMLKYNK